MESSSPIDSSLESDKRPDRTGVFVGALLAGQRAIYAYILSMVVLPSDADDILQDTLTTMWKKFDQFDETKESSFVSWGKKIAHYKALNHLRKYRGSRITFDSDVLEILESKAAQLDDSDDRLDAMKRCLERLSSKHLSVLKMRYTQDMSYSKIAQGFGISKQSIYRAVARIHASLLNCIVEILGQPRKT